MKKYKDRKGINLLTIFLVIDLLAVFAILKTSGAVYTAEAIGTTDLQVAFYAFNTSGLENQTDPSNPEQKETKSIELGEFAPGDEKKYHFTVYNTSEDGTPAETSLSYVLKIVTTTNLPLEFRLYYNESGRSESNVDLIETNNAQVAKQKDEWGTYFYSIVLPEKCFGHSKALKDEYNLYITLPEDTSQSPEYQDVIESVKLQLTSKQVFKEDILSRDLICRES